MVTSPVVMSRMAQLQRQEQGAAIARDRLAARVDTRGQVSPSGWVLSATATFRFLRVRFATQRIGQVQQAQ